MVDIYFDDGTAGKRVCFYDDLTDKACVFEDNKIMSSYTNNELEYIALLNAVKYFVEVYSDHGDRVGFMGDSQLIIR